MILQLKIGNTTVEARHIPAKHLQIAGYFEGLKNEMIEQNADIIDDCQEKPEFSFAKFIDASPTLD